MANVVDPNSWRMIPPPDPQRSVQPNSPSLPDERGGDTAAAPKQRRAETSSAMAQLSTALDKTFASRHDQVIWKFAPTTSGEHPSGEAYVRVDRQHGPAAPTAMASQEESPEQGGARPWLVIVENARDLAVDDSFDLLPTAPEGELHWLLVACDVADPQATESAAVDDTAARTLAAAARLQCRHVGPIAAHNAGELAAALARIKQLGEPTLLHLDARGGGAPPPHFAPQVAPETPEPIVPDTGALRYVAAQALAELARDDERIVAVSSDVDPALADVWEALPGRLFPVDSGVPYALAWCASLASGGSRPFAFLSCEEGQDSLGPIRREICLKRASVTLIIESRRERGSSAASGSSCLAAIRQLPDVSLLAPKDAVELRQMLAWCAAQNDPAVIWLSRPFEHQAAWPQDDEIALGRCEQLRQGRDVAIIAWGPMTAAATIAAEDLARSGIDAGVVNARFARPLDTETIVRAAREATYVLLVDDAQQTGGFAGWVLECLLRAGVTQPTSIVAPPGNADRQDPRDLYNQCARSIVERCRWLAEPAGTPLEVLDGPNVPIVVQDRAVAPNWFTPPDLAVADTRDLPQQILTQQFTTFIDHWVQEYSKVGSRDVYLWRWCLHGLGLTTLSSVAPALRQDLCETKLLAVMYGVMLDDVADQGGADAFLNELTKIIAGAPTKEFSRFSPRQQRYAQFTLELWDSFESRLKCSPCYAQYEELLDYDHRQILNTFAYSSMVNHHPALLNVQEHDMYMPHNMQMMSFATMDLMCSPEFDRDELGKLREVIWHAQSMGRIGNLVSTWQREITDRDFTSGVFARALRQGDLTPEDLRNSASEAIERAIRHGGHEQYFLQKWEAHRQCIAALAPHIHSVDVVQLLVALQRLIHMELSSRGFK